MVEFLVKNKDHWMESLTENKVKDLSKDKKADYDARTKKGDIIVVKPDNWEWGKLEGPPGFVVVKKPEMTMEESNKYVESEYTGSVLTKRRKYSFNLSGTSITNKSTGSVSWHLSS